MNILELILKQHPQVRMERWDASSSTWIGLPGAKEHVTKVAQQTRNWRSLFRKTATAQVRGVRLAPGIRIVVLEAARHWGVFRRGEGIFYARSLGPAASSLRLGWHDAGKALEAAGAEPGKDLETVGVPATVSATADLIIEVPATSKFGTFLGVHRLLDRELLYRRCKGKGVEIGPGPKPQILPAPGVDVTYVEQATPDQWQALYGKDTKTPVDPALWERYVVGNADNIPAAPGTLDFIFSSHVIEHLANPLGHLAYWAGLLKKGGVVAAVIPDMEGCKDFVFTPSTPEELLQEFRDGDMDVKLRHYERWCRHRTPGRDPGDIMESGRSIHVHFYTPGSLRAAVEEHYRGMGFRAFEVMSSPNHKDFYVLLEK